MRDVEILRVMRSKDRQGSRLWLLALCISLSLMSGEAARAGPDSVTSTDVQMKDCEQDDVASFALRACSALLTGDTLDQATRGRVYTLRGKAWLTEDDPASAAEDFTQALKIDAGNLEALKGRVRAYDLVQNYDAAVADWTALIALNLEDSQLYRGRGASNRGAHRFPEAFADYDKSLELNPNGLDAYIGRALVYETMGERENALKEFDRANAVDPNYLMTYWERAQMADRWGLKELAITNYIKVLKINGHYANARKHLERLGVWSPY